MAAAADAEAAEGRALLEALWATGSDDDEQMGDASHLNVQSQKLATSGKLVTYKDASAVVPPVTLLRKSAMLSPLPIKAKVTDPMAVQQKVRGVQAALETKGAAYKAARLEASKCAELVQTMEDSIRSLQEEEQQLLGKVPPAPTRLQRVQQWLSERHAELAAQRVVLEEKQLALLRAESLLRAQETEDDLLADAAAALEDAQAADTAAAAAAAAQMQAREVAGAMGYVRSIEKAQQQAAQRAAQEAAAAEERIRAAQEGQTKARQRLIAAQVSINTSIGTGQALLSQEHDAKAAALVALKGSITSSQKRITKQADLFRHLQKQKREMEAREFEALQEQGLNPYEVYRRRDNAKELEQQRLAMEAGQKLRLAKTTAMMEAEERAAAKAAAKREADRAYEEKYQKEMGVAVQQKRTDAYMRSHTISGEPILDPTSRLKPYPSQAMLVKPKRFGLGGSLQAVIDMVAAKHPTSDLSGSLLLSSRHREGPAGAAGGRSSSNGGDGTGQDRDEDEEDREPASPGSPPADTSSNDRAGSGGRAGSSGREREAGGQLLGRAGRSGRGSMASSDDGEGGASGWRQPKGRVLSKFERDRMAEAHARHKASIAQPKASNGRTFGGDAYIASPQVVEFKDCIPGQMYSCKVTLINRSYTKNTIRLEELPAEALGLITADMAPPGFMAPGTACELLVTFTPRVDADFITSIPLLSITGPFLLPVHCLCRKAVLSISPYPAVEVGGTGGVLVADRASHVVTISNDGALEVLYDIKIEGPLGEVAEITERPLAPGSSELMCSASVAGFTLRGTKGRLGGYSKATFTAEFAPAVPGCVELPLQLRFSAPANKRLAIPPQKLTMVAWGRELPVFAEQPLLDFKCCIAGRGYKDVLVLHNASRAAMKVAVVKRADVAEWLEFLPDMGFIQAGDTFPISVAFKPSINMLQRLPQLVTDADTGTLEVPLKVSVPGQPLPVDFTVRACLTTSHLSITPTTLDFGRCLTCEKKGLVLQLHNGSALPQAVSFGALPQGLSLSPNDGFARLLPGETIELIASFQPPIPGPQFFSLTASSLYGRRITIEGKALGVMPIASLTYNQIKLPATTINDSSALSLSLRNHSEVEQAFEFGVPQGSHLSIAPRVGTLPPKGNVRLQLEFAPPETLLTAHDEQQEQQQQQQGQQQQQQQQQQGQAKADGDTALAAIADDETSSSEQQEQQEQQPGDDAWHVYNKWLLPCYVRPKACVSNPASTTAATTATATSSGNSGGIGPMASRQPGMVDATASTSDTKASTFSATPSAADEGQQVLHCEVVTCAVKQELVLDPPLPKPHGGRKPAVLDFGAVPVGERVTRAITIRNDSLDEVDLDAEPLDPAATFVVVNALRSLAPRNLGPDSSIRLLLAFQPPARSQSFETLTIRTARSKLRINLKGIGIAPEIKISPEEAVAKGLDLGDVLAGEQREAKLTVTNACPFAVTYTTRFLGPTPSSSSSGSSSKGSAPARPGSAVARAAAAAAAVSALQGPFFCRSSEGSLAPGESQEVTVVFAPPAGGGLATPYASDRLQIIVPNQMEELIVSLKGRAWTEGALLAGLQYQAVAADGFANARRSAAVAVAPAAAAAAPAGKGPAPQQAQQQAQQQQQHELSLTLPGCTAPGQTTTATFELGSLKSALGGAPAELILDDLPSSSKEAGWNLDPPKIIAAAGEVKAVTVRFAAPVQPLAGSAVTLGLPEWSELCIGGTLKGGMPAVGGPEGRRVTLRFRCLMVPAAVGGSSGPEGSSKGPASSAAAPAAAKPR